jgi:hypothetical protein
MKNISTKDPRNCRSLHGTPGQVGFVRDDKAGKALPWKVAAEWKAV